MSSRRAPLRAVATAFTLALVLSVDGVEVDGHIPNFLIYQADNMEFIWPEEPVHPPSSGGLDAELEGLPTPHLNRLRDEGVVFTRAYASSTKCTPSRFSTLTGRYPSRSVFAREVTLSCTRWPTANTLTDVTVINNKIDGAFDRENNIATVFKGLGYNTGAFGKWHVSSYEDFERSTEYYESQKAKAENAGFEVVEAFIIGNLNDWGFDPIAEGYSHNLEWLVSETIDFIETSVTAKRPFFAYVNPTPPHVPDILQAIEDLPTTHTAKGVLPTAPDAGNMMSREELSALKGTYGESDQTMGILWVDDALGALLNFLQEAEVLEETVVLFMSDQGTILTNLLFEHGVRIPIFVRYPLLFQGGREVNELVSNIDILPTFVDIACAASKQTVPGLTVDGKSFKALGFPDQEGSEEFQDRILFLEISKTRAAVSEGFKLIRRADEACGGCKSSVDECQHDDDSYPDGNDMTQLYDLETSPDEQKNVFKKPQFKSVLTTMTTALERHIECTKLDVPADSCIEPPPPAPAPTAPPTSSPTATPPTAAPTAPPTSPPTATPATPAPTAPAYGNDGKGKCVGSGIATYTSVDSIEACHGYCQAKPATCKYFSFSADNQECWIGQKCNSRKTEDDWKTYTPSSRRLQDLPQSRGQPPSDPSPVVAPIAALPPAQEVVM